MGFFRKEYTLEEALGKLRKDDKNKYTTMPVNPEREDTKYWVLNKNSIELRKRIEEHKARLQSYDQQSFDVETDSEYKNRRQKFSSMINGNGSYQNIEYPKTSGYNNYQNTRGYRKSVNHHR